METDEYLLKLTGITKQFPGVLALDNVDLELRRNEILAIAGENGAGKSTLIKILSGAYQPDQGEIVLDGVKYSFKTPRSAANAGVSIIYQELNYFNDLSVAENIFVGRLPKYRSGVINWKKLYSDARNVLQELGVDINPKKNIRSLSVAEKQLVEIAKAISKNMKILVMDEPTSALNDSEINILLRLIKNIASSETSVIYVSHRLDEVFEIADRVMVMRDGKRIDVLDAKTTTKNKLVSLMVGRDIKDMYPKTAIDIGDTVLQVDNITNEYIQNISFEVKAGEIYGIYGLLGSGRSELCRALFGVDKIHSGQISIDGEPVKIRSPRDAIRKGLAYIPSERKAEGLVLIQSVRENLITASLKDFVNKLNIIQAKKEIANANKWVDGLTIKTPGINTIVMSLSGGNQQKVVLGKWMQVGPKVLIMNEPTRGIDVGAKTEIYKLIESFCEQGLSVIMISSEMEEILALSDRIMVMSDGKKAGELSENEATQEKLLHYAIGDKR